MSGRNVSWKNFVSGIFLCSLFTLTSVFTSGNVIPEKQHYTCKDSGVQTMPQIQSFQNCQKIYIIINSLSLSLQERVVCDDLGCIPPMINKTAFTGCNIIERHYFCNGIETRQIFKPLLEGAKLTTMPGPYRPGESVWIICSAPENYSAHSFRLTKDGTDTGSSWKTTRLPNDTVEFRIPNISMADSGNYSCSYKAEIRNETFNSNRSNIVAINVVVFIGRKIPGRKISQMALVKIIPSCQKCCNICTQVATKRDRKLSKAQRMKILY
ncbi:uncharacterized protein LOC116988104 [Amblyraja radiata]|uniref:uncharacterized protein LOC116988104 n=1 Tax=Amblyraja radiata TaxID=386614 RepID=UPI0014025716|nr:uncharacterized protein LOC116988104 [Amblyraja radiata]